jgi:hypothetical protein
MHAYKLPQQEVGWVPPCVAVNNLRNGPSEIGCMCGVPGAREAATSGGGDPQQVTGDALADLSTQESFCLYRRRQFTDQHTAQLRSTVSTVLPRPQHLVPEVDKCVMHTCFFVPTRALSSPWAGVHSLAPPRASGVFDPLALSQPHPQITPSQVKSIKDHPSHQTRQTHHSVVKQSRGVTVCYVWTVEGTTRWWVIAWTSWPAPCARAATARRLSRRARASTERWWLRQQRQTLVRLTHSAVVLSVDVVTSVSQPATVSHICIVLWALAAGRVANVISALTRSL